MSWEPEYLPPPGSAHPGSGAAGSGAAAELVSTRPEPREISRPHPDGPLGDLLGDLGQKAEGYRRDSKAASTRRAYTSDWRHFHAWCQGHGLVSLPTTPGAVALYLTALTEPTDGTMPRKVATLTRRLTAINEVHKEAGIDPPATMNHRALAETFQGIRRRLGVGQTMKKPLVRELLVEVLDVLEGPVAAKRDRALLLIGFAGALRRSELAAMRVKDVNEHRKGITIRLPRSKTDQEGKGREVDILWGVHNRTCPVLALKEWLETAGIKEDREGFVFRSVDQTGKVGKGIHPNSIGRLVKDLVRKANISHPEEYSGHSLRAGFVTEASAGGATDGQIMKQTGHKTPMMVRRYARGDTEDRQTAESKLGL
jgi:integrase